ncbi:MAG: transposase [Spartobacteria bacterium]
MDSKSLPETAHPAGEAKNEDFPHDKPNPGASALPVDTGGGRYHVQWDDSAPVTPLGQLVFFAQFLHAGGRWEDFCKEAPFGFTSPNAPTHEDVLGSLAVSILCGHTRYAHVNALRFDAVNPAMLGMKKVVSEDSARRNLKKLEQIEARKWQRKHLRETWERLLYEPWMLDIDTTVKTVFGHQEGAEVGYNPHKPGRPSHAYHTYWIARLRLCLDVEVRPGNQSSSSHGMPALWELIDSLPLECRPQAIRGDCNYGNEANMVECEKRGIPYLFKLRQTAKVKNLISLLEQEGGWVDCGQGFKGIEGEVRLGGWSCKRRVIVALRLVKQETTEDDKKALPLLTQNGELPLEVVSYEHIVLVSTLPYEVASLVPLYRERGDAENPFDELKNQWGWAGFTTQDMDRCQVTARLIAQIYNWWSLYARLVDRERHREAVTTRPELLGGVARQTRHAGQTRISISLSHSKVSLIKEKLAEASAFLQGLITTAEQLTAPQRWERILLRIFEKFIQPKLENIGLPLPATG